MSHDLIRVVLVDDHAVVRAGLKAVLGLARDITVVGEASGGREAVAVIEGLRPDVVIMDLSMPDGDGATATKAIVSKGLGCQILILTMHSEDEYLMPAMQSGASGYLVKTDADRELVAAVRAVARGEVYVRTAAARILAKNIAKKDPGQTEREKYERLTDRERAVLRLVGLGYTAPEIGERLLISPKTVDTYKQRIQEKLQLSHRTQYVQLALRLGLLTQPET